MQPVTESVTWPQVVMTLVIMIPSLTATIIAAIMTCRASMKAATAGMAAAVTAGESVKASKVNTVKLDEVKTELASNTYDTSKTLESVGFSAEHLIEIKRLVNGERDQLKAEIKDLRAQVDEIKSLPVNIQEQLLRHRDADKAQIDLIQHILEERNKFYPIPPVAPTPVTSPTSPASPK